MLCKKFLKLPRSILRLDSSYCQQSIPLDLSYAIFPPAPPVHLSKPPLLILHGLLGSKMNWRSLAKAISTKCERQVYTLDARNHGDSPHSEVFDYHVMAKDVQNFVEKQQISSFSLLGHSMGGRTAMMIALTQPEIIEKLIVVDVSPVSMPESSSEIAVFMKGMQEALKIISPDFSVSEARKAADRYMAKFIPNTDMRQFLLTNLVQKNGVISWKANVDVIERCFNSSILSFPSVSGTYDGETLFVCGENSPYMRPDDHAPIRLLFPKVAFVNIVGAGHFVHSEKPDEFLTSIEKAL